MTAVSAGHGRDLPPEDDDHRIKGPSRTLVTSSSIPRKVLYPPGSKGFGMRMRPNTEQPRGLRRVETGGPGNS